MLPVLYDNNYTNRPYQKKTIFFSAAKFFRHIFSFDSPQTMLSSQGVTTFTLNFSPCFLIRKAVVWNM